MRVQPRPHDSALGGRGANARPKTFFGEVLKAAQKAGFVANGRMIRLGDFAEVRRSPADPPQPIFRENGQEAIGLATAMRDSGDILALGKNIEHAMAEIRADLPVGIEPKLVAEQPVTVEHAVNEFMEACGRPSRS